MRFGLYLRNMGPASEPTTLVESARAAERAGVEELWVADHIAIPPDEAEGSNGRYLDPLATLAYLAAATEKVKLGTGVLVLPYRSPLPTAKWVATIQELSGGRLMFGAGVGWMKPEFDVLGVDRGRRGAVTDRTLDLIVRCFADDVVEENGQAFLFRPRPPRPEILIGGSAPHALARAVRFGDGWMPIGGDASSLGEPIRQLAEMAAAAGKPAPQVVLITGLALEDRARAVDQVAQLAAVGVTGVVHGLRYETAAEFAHAAEGLAAVADEVATGGSTP